MTHLRANRTIDQKLAEQGRAIAAKGTTRTFPPSEVQKMLGIDACGQFHRINQGELEYRGRDEDWSTVHPWDDGAEDDRPIGEAITNYIHERVAIEGEPAMIPEPDPIEEPEADLPALRRAAGEAVQAARTMPELEQVTRKADWEKCEDGTLQDLIFDTNTLRELLPIVGPMAEALARRLKAEEAVGSTPPPADTQALQAYQDLLARRRPETERFRAFMAR